MPEMGRKYKVFKSNKTAFYGFVISNQDVFKSLSRLKEEKCPGPDGLHPMVLKRLAKKWTMDSALHHSIKKIHGKWLNSKRVKMGSMRM
jgi:hypothetical protein